MGKPSNLQELELFVRGKAPRDRLGLWKRWRLTARELRAYEEAKRQGWLRCPTGGKKSLGYVWSWYCDLKGHPHCYALSTGGGYFLSLYLTGGRIWDEAGQAALWQFALGVSRHVRRDPDPVTVVSDSVAFHLARDDVDVAAAQLCDLAIDLAYPTPPPGHRWALAPLSPERPGGAPS